MTLLVTLRRAGLVREVEKVNESLHVTSRQDVLAYGSPIYALEVLLRYLIAGQQRGILVRRWEAVAQP